MVAFCAVSSLSPKGQLLAEDLHDIFHQFLCLLFGCLIDHILVCFLILGLSDTLTDLGSFVDNKAHK